MTMLTDAVLVDRVVAGFEGDFDELYRRHASTAWRVAQAVTGNAHDGHSTRRVPKPLSVNGWFSGASKQGWCRGAYGCWWPGCDRSEEPAFRMRAGHSGLRRRS